MSARERANAIWFKPRNPAALIEPARDAIRDAELRAKSAQRDISKLSSFAHAHSCLKQSERDAAKALADQTIGECVTLEAFAAEARSLVSKIRSALEGGR